MRIGTRGSKLALAQTNIVVQSLREHEPRLELEVVPISTLGDRLPSEQRALVDGKAAFTGDIDSLLVDGEVDIAVHSMKDLPSILDDALLLAATPPRADARDLLVSRDGLPLSKLPHGAKVGTSSLRRRIQLLRMRDDLDTVDLYGNIETRMSRVGESLDATVLAAAGLERIGALDRAAQYFAVDEMVPAACQGILAVLTRSEDRDASRLVRIVEDDVARLEATCERSFLRALGGDCDVPAGCKATFRRGTVFAIGMMASPDGSKFFKKSAEGDARSAGPVGTRLARDLLEMSGERLSGISG